MDRGIVLLVSGASATLHVPFILHSFACIFPSLIFHLHAYSFDFAVMSCHFPFILLSCSFHVYSFPSSSFHVPFIFIPMCIHAFMSFHFLSKVMEIAWNGSMAWPGERVQQMFIAKLSLRLSLNNPSNIWHCSKEICHTNDRERERER